MLRAAGVQGGGEAGRGDWGRVLASRARCACGCINPPHAPLDHVKDDRLGQQGDVHPRPGNDVAAPGFIVACSKGARSHSIEPQAHGGPPLCAASGGLRSALPNQARTANEINDGIHWSALEHLVKLGLGVINHLVSAQLRAAARGAY